MKRFFALLLALVLATSLFGCQSSSESPAGSGSDESGMEPVTYKVFINKTAADVPPDGGSAKLELQKRWEEDLGITNTDYEVLLANSSDYETKLNSMLAGGDVPDLFSVNVDQLQTLVDNGLVVPVDEYVANMPHYNARLTDEAKINYDNFSIDGKHYGLTYTVLEGELSGNGSKGLSIRMDWLDNLGLSVPTTLDELHDVLYAFTYNDPDGNGKDDTYGLGTDKTEFISPVFGAFGIYLNGINSWMERDGELVHSTTLPETKEALAVLRQWYAEGLIDPDKFVVEAQQAEDKFISGKFGVWMTDVFNANDARIAWANNEVDASCAFIPPPEGPDGEKGTSITPVVNMAMVISADCAENKDVDRLIKILDWMVNDDEDGGLKLVEYGLEGVHYTYDPETDFIDQSLISGYDELYREGYSTPIRWITVTDRRWIAPDDPRATDLTLANQEENLNVAIFDSTVPAMKDYPDLYDVLWNEYYTKIIMGTLELDAFDEYVEKFYAQGGTELTEQVNEKWKANASL